MSATKVTARAGFGLAGKIFVSSVLVVLAVLAASFGLTSIQANRTADAAVTQALLRTRRAVGGQLDARAAALARASTAAALVPQFRDRILRSAALQDRVDQADEYRSMTGAAWVLVTDAEGILLARTDYPQESGQDLSRGALIGRALDGEQPVGAFVDDRDPAATRLYLAVATPLVDAAEAAPRGVLVTTFALDDTLAVQLDSLTGADVALVAFDTAGGPIVVGSTLPRDSLAAGLTGTLAPDMVADDSSATAMNWQLGGRHLLGLAGAIRSAGGDVFGAFVAFRAREAELAAFQALRRAMFLAVGIGVVVALISAFALARQIAGPVRRLALATRRVQDGDYDVEIDASGRDEIGQLGRAFRRLVEDLREKAGLVEYMMAASGAAATQPLDSARTEFRAAAARPSVSGGEALRPGQVFANRYEVKEILGVGGMGVVYRAVDRELGEAVAIKTLRTDALTQDGVALERFKQEIRLARRITHRNVVRTYDLGEVNGTYYLTMEYVEGTSLKQLIQGRGALPLSVTLTVGKQLCRALEVAHEQGVIHRDIKPQNAVVEPSGVLKVMDFGIARLANPPKGRDQKGLTEAGTSIGTPDYMSPEQLMGQELDPRSDLYAVGVVLFECVTGRLPFEAETTWALVAKHLEETPPDPRTLNKDVPPALSAVILKAMAKERDARHRSASELYEALAALG